MRVGVGTDRPHVTARERRLDIAQRLERNTTAIAIAHLFDTQRARLLQIHHVDTRLDARRQRNADLGSGLCVEGRYSLGGRPLA